MEQHCPIFSNDIEQPVNNLTTPTLVLLHGATMNAHMWDAVRRHLHPQYRVIAPDLPGHGSRRSEEFTFAGAIETVRASVASLAGAPVILVGDSLGGYTAQAAAPLIADEQLKGLVLGGSTAILKGPNYLPYWATVGLFRLLIACFGEPWLIRNGAERSLRRQGIAEQDIASLSKAGLSLRAFAPAVAAIRDFDALKNLRTIAKPTLFINGDRDAGMVRGEPQFLALARNGRAHRFEKCGHGVSMLRSAEFATLVNQFAFEVFD
jgi:pimeloyl-ACP methyl ester carboxylesterase